MHGDVRCGGVHYCGGGDIAQLVGLLCEGCLPASRVGGCDIVPEHEQRADGNRGLPFNQSTYRHLIGHGVFLTIEIKCGAGGSPTVCTDGIGLVVAVLLLVGAWVVPH